jgi:hypothetical protein
MADAEKLVPGTWFVTVTDPAGQLHRTVMTFTSDEGMVERAEGFLETAVGVWKPGDKEDEFRFMFYRFSESLTISEPQEERKGETEEQEAVSVSFAITQRVRSTNRLISDDVFEGTGTVDFLDAAGTLVPGIPAFRTKQRAIRLNLVRE